MGVLYDYFRAVDEDTACTAVDRPGGPLPADGPGAAFDGVAARGIDPVVALGHLIAFVRGVTWTPDLVEVDTIARSTVTGGWVERLGEPVRDALAGAADDALPEIVVKWSQLDDVAPADAADTAGATEWLAVVTDLVGLARRARAADQDLYCWCCL